MDYIIEELMKETKKSLRTEDVPVGAFIFKNGKLIGKGHNSRQKDQTVLGHAEINAIEKASKKLKTWNLSGCEMIVALKPCSMCMEIIKQSRIDKVYYLLDKPSEKHEYNDTKFEKLEGSKLEETYGGILSKFFKELREKMD